MNSASATDVVKAVTEGSASWELRGCSGTAESGSRLAGSPGGRGGAAMEMAPKDQGVSISMVQCRWHDMHSRSDGCCSKVCCWCSASWDCEVRSLRRRHRRITCRSLRRWHRRITCWSLRRWRRRIRECRSPWSSVGGMTGTAEVTAGAKSVAAARPPGGAKDMAMTAATAVVP